MGVGGFIFVDFYDVSGKFGNGIYHKCYKGWCVC